MTFLIHPLPEDQWYSVIYQHIFKKYNYLAASDHLNLMCPLPHINFLGHSLLLIAH